MDHSQQVYCIENPHLDDEGMRRRLVYECGERLLDPGEERLAGAKVQAREGGGGVHGRSEEHSISSSVSVAELG